MVQRFDFLLSVNATQLRLSKALGEENHPTAVTRENGEHRFSWAVLQLCSHPVVGWQNAPPGIFGLWSIQVAPI